MVYYPYPTLPLPAWGKGAVTVSFPTCALIFQGLCSCQALCVVTQFLRPCFSDSYSAFLVQFSLYY